MKKSLSDIGEFKFIENISKDISRGFSVIKGIGDDCAVLKYTKAKHLLFTTDVIVEDVHFIRKKVSPRSIGHKALAVNISDIAACGGMPKWAVVSAGLPRSITDSYARCIYKGMNELANRFGIGLVGGDTSVSDKIFLSIALLGEAKAGGVIMRNGAKEGEAIVITGPIGLKPDHLGFIPRIRESQFIVKNLSPGAMIDISDGLLQDLGHILKSSQKGAYLYKPLIPVSCPGKDMIKALNTGEQFELIFTMPKEKIHLLPKGFYVIGEIIKQRPFIYMVDNIGTRKRIMPKGYAHFK
jgi:thiamine-monophosphate kinase